MKASISLTFGFLIDNTLQGISFLKQQLNDSRKTGLSQASSVQCSIIVLRPSEPSYRIPVLHLNACCCITALHANRYLKPLSIFQTPSPLLSFVSRACLLKGSLAPSGWEYKCPPQAFARPKNVICPHSNQSLPYQIGTTSLADLMESTPLR
jgi:hypothetical protein